MPNVRNNTLEPKPLILEQNVILYKYLKLNCKEIILIAFCSKINGLGSNVLVNYVPNISQITDEPDLSDHRFSELPRFSERGAADQFFMK